MSDVCCVGTCQRQARFAIRFAPHGVRVFEYCIYHARSRDGTGWRWRPWLIVSVKEIR